MKESEIIQGVLDLLATPEAWIKNIRGMSAHGEPLEVPSERAVSWCLGGAVMQVTQRAGWCGWFVYGDDPVGRRFSRLARARGYDDIHSPFVEFNDAVETTHEDIHSPFVEFNDAAETTHEDILLFLKEALYEAQAEEAAAAIEENLAAWAALAEEAGV